MPFDSTRVNNNAGAIESHLTEFAAQSSVSSIDSWGMVPEQERAANVIVTIEYTAA